MEAATNSSITPITVLDRGVSTCTSVTTSSRNTVNTTTTTATNRTDQAHTIPRNDADAGDDDEVFSDSIFAESVIRMRSQIHRDESRRASLTMSQTAATELSNELQDESTISSNMSRPPGMNYTISTATISSQDPTVSSHEADTVSKEMERALLLGSEASPQNDNVSVVPEELNASLDLIKKKRITPTVVSRVPLGGSVTVRTNTLGRNDAFDELGNHEFPNRNDAIAADEAMYDSQHDIDSSHVNHTPIIAFSVPDTTPPIQAIPVLMGSPDVDDDDDDDPRNTGNRHTFDSGTDDLGKKNQFKGKRNLMAILLLSVIASVIVTALLVGSICGSGAVSCRRSTNSASESNSNNNSPQSPPTRNSDSADIDEYDERASRIYSYVNNISYVREDDTTMIPSNVSGSALKNRATDWMIYDDPLQLNLTEESGPDDFFHIRQRYALTAFYFHTSINSVWTNHTGWLSNTHECYWYGIVCSEIDHGMDIGIQNTVIGLNLTYNNLNGRIPDDLAFLSNLEQVLFGFNALSGSIPETLGQCTDLEYVELSFNSPLTGTLPGSIGNWNKIILFDVSNNFFSGSIPSALSSWRNITTFSVSSNLFNSTFPSSFDVWTRLEFFDSNLNQFYGTLPDSIGDWSTIKSFQILGNNLNGTIPTTVGSWTNLFLLSLEDNDFSGTIPTVIGTLQNLQYAKFENNDITGSVPQGLCDNDIISLVTNCSVDCECCTDCY